MSTANNEFDFYQFVLQKHKFRLDSGLKVKGEEVIFGLALDNQQGIVFLDNGNSRFTVDQTSLETVGRKIGAFSNVPAKIIEASNGDIVLNAKKGDIVLQGANIRIKSVDGKGGEITISSSGIVQIDAVTLNSQTTNTTLTASNQLSTAGGSLGNFGEMIAETAVSTDLENSSFLGRILSTITKFKEFFNSNCT